MGKSEREYYQSLWILATAINLARTRENVLRSVVEHAAQTMEAKGCSIMLLTPDKEYLLHTVTHGISDSYIGKGPISADKSISDALQGIPVAVIDATEDNRIQYREQAEKEGVASILSMPMRLKQEIIGMLRVYTAKPYKFTREDMYYLGGVANLGAIALENARLYEAVDEDYDEFRKDILEWRSALGHEWHIGKSLVPVVE